MLLTPITGFSEEDQVLICSYESDTEFQICSKPNPTDSLKEFSCVQVPKSKIGVKVNEILLATIKLIDVLNNRTSTKVSWEGFVSIDCKNDNIAYMKLPSKEWTDWEYKQSGSLFWNMIDKVCSL